MHIDQVMEVLKHKFTSGNSVPVERNTITRAEYDAILGFYQRITTTSPESVENFRKIAEAPEGTFSAEAILKAVRNREEMMIQDLLDTIQFSLFTDISNGDSPEVKLTYGSYLSMGDTREVRFHIHKNDMPPAEAWLEESTGDIISDGLKQSTNRKHNFHETHTSALIKIIPDMDDEA